MNWLFKDTNRPAGMDAKTARKTATLISLPFAGMGLLALAMLVHDGVLGGLTRESAIKLGSVVVVAAGFIALIFGIFAKKTSMAEQVKASLKTGDKPWLKREDWAAGRIKSSGIPHERSYLIMGIVLTALGLLIALLLVPMAIRTKNYSDFVGLFFPIVGIIFLYSICKKMRASKQFGDCFFEMAQVPASPGGRLEGSLHTALPPNPNQKVGIQISCVHSIVAGAGQHRRTEEKVLWKDEKVTKTPADSNPGGGKMPVQFELPPDQPPCSQRGNETVSWRLLVLIPQANFRATFDVPVFKIDPQPT